MGLMFWPSSLSRLVSVYSLIFRFLFAHSQDGRGRDERLKLQSLPLLHLSGAEFKRLYRVPEGLKEIVLSISYLLPDR